MTTAIKSTSMSMSMPSTHMRQIKLPHDLGPIADLIELSFARTLDADGRRFIQQMRRAAASVRGYRSFSRFSPQIRGFVWEENDEIVGNLNLIPIVVAGRRSFLMANVAVHPDYRNKGIAHVLAEAGLQEAKDNSASEVWLQVDVDNLAAQQLYRDFEFSERTRRTLWHSSPETIEIDLPPSVTVQPSRRADWNLQKQWLNQRYPKDMRWNLPMDPMMLKPGLVGNFLRSVSESRYGQFSAHRNGDWLGAVAWQSSHNFADWLWLAAPPEQVELAICALLPHAIRTLRAQRALAFSRPLALNFPAGEAVGAFEAVGFHQHQTLIWMRKKVS